MQRTIYSRLIALALASIALVSCTYEGDVTNVTVYKDAEEESTAFITEGLPYYKNSDDVADVMYVRFYDDDRYVPYVAASYYLEEFGKFTLKSSSYADGKYKYQNLYKGKSFPLTIDVKSDTIYCPEWVGFITKTNEAAIEDEAWVDKFLHIIKTFTGQKAQTFDLHAYGFKIYGGLDDAYVPLCVMNQLFSCQDYNRFVYNGEAVYYIDSSGSHKYDDYTKSSWYVNDDGSIADRPAELIELSYNMLCFIHDYLYGKPGYYGFADDGTGHADPVKVAAADSLSFDQILKTYDSETCELLHSSSYFDYYTGMQQLCYYTYGDEHTALHTKKYIPFSQDEYNAATGNLKSKISKRISKDLSLSKELEAKRFDAGKATGDTAEDSTPVEFELLAGGKTAVIRFDTFDLDYIGWDNFYDRDVLTACPNPDPSDDEIASGAVAVPNDTMGLVYRAFYTLLNDSEYANVKNVIVDLSCNGGGVNITNQKILGYFVGNGNVLQYDVHTGTMYHEHVTCDLNLDGETDSLDTAYYKALEERFNFAVLTSFASFSNGNTFPCICADNGIPIIGERSGGGSCVVMQACTADGWPFQYSGSWRLSHPDGTSVENGAPVTKMLTHDEFYNDSVLQAVMDELYPEE